MSGPRSLRRTLGRAFFAVGAVLFLVVSLSALALVRVGHVQDEVTVGYFDAIDESTAARRALDDAPDLLDAYLASGDPAPLAILRTDTAGWSRDALPVGARVELTRPSVTIGLARETAIRAIGAWMESEVEPVLAAAETPSSPSSVEPSVGSGVSASEAYQEAQSALAFYDRSLVADRSERLASLERWTAVLYGAVVTIAVAFGLACWWLWRVVDRRVTRPVADLAANVRRATAGDHSVPIAVTGSGEVVDLSRDIEHMRGELVQQTAEVVASRAEVEEAHDLLVAQAAELERSNRDLEQFAYVASHDLQEPLRKVASFTQLLKKRYGGQLDDRADQYIEFAVDGAKRMQRLIQDLLGFSRVGRSGSERVDVDLERSLATALGDLDARIEESGAEVTFDPLPTVHGEPALLVQLFVNVVGNAIKFRDPERPPRVHIGVVSHGTHWEMSCTDNGIGIDAQYAERVFVIFQRLHAKEVYEGTGIGLAMCKRIVEYHGGQIWVEPAPEHGTTVRWTIAHRYVAASERWSDA